MTDDTVCPECGRTFVDTGGYDGMTTYIHSIDDSGQLASVDDYCFSDDLIVELLQSEGEE